MRRILGHISSSPGPVGEITEQICLLQLSPPCSKDTHLLRQETLVPAREGRFCCLGYHSPEHGVGLSGSFLAGKKEQANYQRSCLVCLAETRPSLRRAPSQKFERHARPCCLCVGRPCCSTPKCCGNDKRLSLWRSIPRRAHREACGSGLVLQAVAAEGLWLLTAALLTLPGADVPRGPAGQRPKQTPGEDQFASALTWKGLWIWRCCNNIVLSSVSVIICIWTHSCAAWFVSKIHQSFEIPFPRPSWQHTGISQLW